MLCTVHYNVLICLFTDKAYSEFSVSKTFGYWTTRYWFLVLLEFFSPKVNTKKGNYLPRWPTSLLQIKRFFLEIRKTNFLNPLRNKIFHLSNKVSSVCFAQLLCHYLFYPLISTSSLKQKLTICQDKRINTEWMNVLCNHAEWMNALCNHAEWMYCINLTLSKKMFSNELLWALQIKFS